MSVTPMKLATIVGPLDTFDAFARRCIVGREFHPEPASVVMQNVKGLRVFEGQNPYAEPLRHAERLLELTHIEPDYVAFDTDKTDLNICAAYLRSLDERFSAMVAERDGLTHRLSEDEAIGRQLALLKDMRLPIQELMRFEFAKFRFGRIPRDVYDTFHGLIQARNDIYFFVTDLRKDYVYCMYLTPRTSKVQSDALFGSLQFERVQLSDRIRSFDTDIGAGDALRQDIAMAMRRCEEIDKEFARAVSEERESFLRYYCYLRFMNDAFSLRRYAARTAESFYFLGWLPSHEYDDLEQTMAQMEDGRFVLIHEDPETMEDYTPPTKLRNSLIFKPFEPFVQMYGLPSYNEIDPTPLMSMTYPIIFGAMFGDIGHGALLLLAGLLMWFGKGMWIGRVLCYCAVSSVVFGFIFGSIFGNEHLLPGFKVLESSHETHKMLEITMYAGAVMMALVIILNIINGFRQRNAEKKFFGANSLLGLLMYVGIVFTVLPYLGFGSSPLPLPLLLVFIVSPIIPVFLKEPLTHLAEKKKVHLEDGVGNFIIANFFEMFEVLLSFVTNTLSFLRIGAYAVSHASMMTVVYTLAQASDGTHSLPVLIIGNLVVAGIEGLLVAIQVLRLEFYEIFGRFYSGSGKPFTPMITDYKKRRG